MTSDTPRTRSRHERGSARHGRMGRALPLSRVARLKVQRTARFMARLSPFIDHRNDERRVGEPTNDSDGTREKHVAFRKDARFRTGPIDQVRSHYVNYRLIRKSYYCPRDIPLARATKRVPRVGTSLISRRTSTTGFRNGRFVKI